MNDKNNTQEVIKPTEDSVTKSDIEQIIHTLEVCKDESLALYELKELLKKAKD